MLGQTHIGDCRDTMRRMQAAGVRAQCCVTSVPYWQMRDYGAPGQLGLEAALDCLGWATGDSCGECWVCGQVDVFRHVRSVLTDDGTVWLNIGDSYSSGGGSGAQGSAGQRADRRHTQQALMPNSARAAGLKPKDLCMQPARLALALQADGWYVRQDIIWHKTQPMPESCRDRCTKAHEYVWLLSKRPRYYYDARRDPRAGQREHARSQVA